MAQAKEKTGSAETMRTILLHALRNGSDNDGYISGEVLSAKLHISRSAIWKHIRNLRSEGYDIASTTNKGYKLLSTPDRLLPAELSFGLKTKMVGGEIKYYSNISSTNEEGRRLAEQGSAEGTVVVAEVQSLGRGRRGRAWASPGGGIWLSIVLRPKIAPNNAPALTLLTGVAVAQTIHEFTGLIAALKWPNDVRISEKKVCGILTEINAELDMINYIVVGMGINANISLNRFPPELRDSVTSLQLELNQEINRVGFVRSLLEKFEDHYLDFCSGDPGNATEILEAWRQLTDTIGREVMIKTINGTITGTAVDIANDGVLLVQAETGDIQRIIAGDCVYLDQ